MFYACRGKGLESRLVDGRTMRPSVSRSRLLVGVAIAWGLLVGGGLLGLGALEARPGDPGDSARAWPAEGRIARVEGRSNLILWVHPRCPCSRASLDALGRLVAARPGR